MAHVDREWQLESLGRIIERPDGFYWQAEESEDEYGPYASLSEAEDDMRFAADDGYEPDAPDSLEEAEAEMGLGWIDPETGEPGEDGAPRLADH